MSLRLGEKLLLDHVRALFPNEKIQENIRKHSELVHTSTGSYLELDILLPKYNLCFEYQDPYHYITTWFNHVPSAYVRLKDEAKRTMARKRGLTLVVVPCWWDECEGSLAATIGFYLPHIVTPNSNMKPTRVIPLNPPDGFFEASPIPGVGELMAASFPLDSKLIASRNLWWIGEKYDGIRCCWNAFYRELFTRNGTKIPLPASFVSWLPSHTFLDSELWFGRGLFQLSYSLLTGAPHQSIFDSIRMLTFDIPNHSFKKRPFEDRYSRLLMSVDTEHPFILVNFRTLCKNRLHLHLIVENIIVNGGEGAVLRKLGSFYESGRSNALLKLKTAHERDEEAIVEGFGHQKSINLKLPNGTIFTVPSQDSQITNLKLGDVVTFTFDTTARRDVPQNPKIVRLRTDMSWQDVVKKYQQEKTYINVSSSVSGFRARPPGYWTQHRMRSFFEQVAKSKSLDPLLAETWYSIPAEEVRRLPGGTTLMSKMTGGYYKILGSLFPEITFKKLSTTPWVDINNRRRFFEDFAAKMGFDPHVPDGWYSIRQNKFPQMKSVLAYYGDSLSRALLDLFPNIPFDIYKFRAPKSFWKKETNRRKFFENYAKENNFDPLHANSWYSQLVSRIATNKRARSVLGYYNESVPTALTTLFPNIGLDPDKFVRYIKRDFNHRRAFFEKYAKENNFDPLIANNWYMQSKSKILATKDATKIIRKHGSSVPRALVELFPEIGLKREKIH